MTDFLKKNKKLILSIILPILFSGLFYIILGIYYWVNTESTENAYIEGYISNVSSEVNAVIKKILVEDNALVKQDQIIAELDDEEYIANYRAALEAKEALQVKIKAFDRQILVEELKLEQNKNAMDIKLKNEKFFSTNHERTIKLNNKDVISKQKEEESELALAKSITELKEIELNRKIIEENISLIKNQKLAEQHNLSLLEEKQKIAKRNLENTKIKAPVAGVLVSNNMQIGNFARAFAPLFSIAQEKIYIKANFKEGQIRNIKNKDQAKIEIDGLPCITLSATVRAIYPATGAKFSLISPDNATGNFTKIVQRVPVILDFNNTTSFHAIKNKIKIGMSATVSIRKNQ